MKEKNVNDLVSVIENGSYQEIENLLPLVNKIYNFDVLDIIGASFIKHRDICLQLIENEKLPENILNYFIENCSFEEFMFALSRSDEYLTYESLRSFAHKEEYLQQIVQSNNTENILRITRIPDMPLSIQIYLLSCGNDKLTQSFLEHNYEFAELIVEFIIFSKNKKWYQWALEDKYKHLRVINSKLNMSISTELEDKIVNSNDEEIINFAIDGCRLPDPYKILKLGNPKLIEKLVQSRYYQEIINWAIENDREDLLSIVIEEHFMAFPIPKTVLEKKHNLMQQYIQKLQNYATELQTEYQLGNISLDCFDLLKFLLKKYNIPHEYTDNGIPVISK